MVIGLLRCSRSAWLIIFPETFILSEYGIISPWNCVIIHQHFQICYFLHVDFCAIFTKRFIFFFAYIKCYSFNISLFVLFIIFCFVKSRQENTSIYNLCILYTQYALYLSDIPIWTIRTECGIISTWSRERDWIYGILHIVPHGRAICKPQQFNTRILKTW